MVDTYRFQVGEFQCIAINDGNFLYQDPRSNFFANAPKNELEQCLRRQGLELEEWTTYLSPFTCLAIQSTDTCVLVDTGIGTGLAPGSGMLVGCLKGEGISPDKVDTVLLTHGHADHIGGNTDDEQRVNFPNARFIMAKAEWDYWTAEETLAGDEWAVKWVSKNLQGLADRFYLIEADTDISPGIQAIFTCGHTPGHLIASIRSKGELLLYTSDIFIHPIHVEHPDWFTIYENQSQQAVSTRLKVLEMAVGADTRVLAFHFPFPGLGRISRTEGGYRWLVD